MQTATFRIYAELNDFLPKQKKQVSFEYSFAGPLKVHEAILSLHIPLSEVDLILVNGCSKGVDYWISNGDYISVYPVFESFNISSLNSLRPEPLRNSKFILDVHLGKLAKFLRMAGFDTLYSSTFKDAEIIDISVESGRIILTRDNGLLRSVKVKHGYYIRNIDPVKQFKEVVSKFDLGSQFKPMERCLKCNNLLEMAVKEELPGKIKPDILNRFSHFYTCRQCNHIYWHGSHYDRMKAFLKTIIDS